MSKKHKHNKNIYRITFMILLYFCSFMLGFTINSAINNKVEEKIASRPQVKIVPN